MAATSRRTTAFLAVDEANLHRWVDGFLIAKQAEGLATSTLKIYRANLSHFVGYCEARGATTIESIDPGLLREYLLALTERHNESGRHQYYRTIKTFLFWYENEAAPDGWRNPIRKVPAPKLPEKILDPVKVDDVWRMVDSCRDDLLGLRDRAILLTLLDTGSRAGELTAFDLADFDPVKGALTIRHGKGGKGRVVFTGQKTRKAIRAYTKFRGDAPGPLFLTRSGERLDYNGLRTMIRRRAMDAEVSPIPSPHDFRRAFALEMLRAGADTLTLQRLLGHADMSILKRYIKQTSADLQAAHAEHSPVDRARL